MKGKFFIKQRAYSYFVLCFILLIAVLAFYLSCQSKSPTDATAHSIETLEAQGAKNTTQTTTSSSTTTTIKPGNSPTNTTSLITSRNLTTTSTSTTSTSTSTTTSIPTTTTSTGNPILQWCWVKANGNTVSESFINVRLEQIVVISFAIKNTGNAPLKNCEVTLTILEQNPAGFCKIINDSSKTFGPIPNDGRCVKVPNAFEIEIMGGLVKGQANANSVPYCVLILHGCGDLPGVPIFLRLDTTPA